MAKKFLLALLALLAMTMQAQIEVEVSETVELMGILSRTAGFEEYNRDMAGQYTKDTEAWFAPFKNHPTVSYYKKLRQMYNISFNCPMELALGLDIDGQQIRYKSDKAFMNERWANVDIDAFVTNLNKFYVDTRFHEFFMQHQPFYEDGLKLYRNRVMKHFHQDWYSRFYGTNPDEQYHIIIGFTNGSGNYAYSQQLPGMPKEIFSVVGYGLLPRASMAFEDGLGSAQILIHEFNHCFINPLYDDNKTTIVPVAGKLFRLSENMMYNEHYDEPTSVLNETLVRAAVILYMQEYGYTTEQVAEEMFKNMDIGFTWMPEAVTALRDYARNRSKYPTFNDAYPMISNVLDNFADAELEKFNQAINAKIKPHRNSETVKYQAEAMETVELMGVLSRLAKYQEYYFNDISETYARAIDQWFEPFLQHPVIEFYQGLRQKYDICFDAPMNLAVHFAIEDGKIVRVKEMNALSERTLDRRWSRVNMNDFLSLLNQFYTDTRFHEFYEKHQPFYQQKLKVFNDNVMCRIHQEWFETFFGKPTDLRSRIIIGFANGPGMYSAGCHPQDQSREFFTILGDDGTDFSDPKEEDRKVDFSRMLISTMSDSSVPLLSDDVKGSAEIDGIGGQLLKSNKNLSSNYSISDGTSVMSESLATAASIIYMIQNGYDTQHVFWQLSRETSTYPWMPDLVTALGEYANNRNKYKVISDFFPRLATLMNKYLQEENERYAKALK